MTQNSSENFKPFSRLHFGSGSVVRPPSNGEELTDIQHSMSVVLNTRFHIWFIVTVYYKMRQILLQNATDIITKWDSYFIAKCDRSLLQNTSGFLLQNETILLQNATVITKWDVYYKLCQYRHKYSFFNKCICLVFLIKKADISLKQIFQALSIFHYTKMLYNMLSSFLMYLLLVTLAHFNFFGL